jgi:hypothetical protein
MAAGGKTTLLKDPHRDGKKARQPGPGGRDEEPVEKAKPEVRVKEHAVKTAKKGRPAHDIGDSNLAEPKDPDAR